MDNYHQSISSVFDGTVLRVEFSGGEILEVWEPSEIMLDGITLTIPKASKVRWSWYYYGKPHIPENLRHHEYIPEGNRVLSGLSGLPNNKASIHKAAVAIC